MNRFLQELGIELRAARRRSGFRLREIAARSGGVFKASAIGGYERGERSISVERLCKLSQTYGVRPDRLLLRALSRLDSSGRRDIIVDLRAEASVSQEDEILTGLAHEVARMRGIDANGRLTLRSSDLELLGEQAGIGIERLLASPFVATAAADP